MRRAARNALCWMNRRKFWLLALAVVGWLLYLPVHPYRPYCGLTTTREEEKIYFSPVLSPEYREHLGYGLSASGVPYVILGPYVFVPFIGWMDNLHSWRNINDVAVLASINRYRDDPTTHPRMKRVILDYEAAWNREINDKAYPKEEYLKHWCAVVEAVVTPGWADGDKGDP